MALNRPVLIPQILSRGFPAAMNLLGTVYFVVQLGSKAWLKHSWYDPGCSGNCRSVDPWLS